MSSLEISQPSQVYSKTVNTPGTAANTVNVQTVQADNYFMGVSRIIGCKAAVTNIIDVNATMNAGSFPVLVINSVGNFTVLNSPITIFWVNEVGANLLQC